MKNVQEAAHEYAEKTVDQCKNISISTLKEYAQIDFQEGVKFALQWIPITKEFPYGECLLQNDKGKNSFFDFTGANDSDIQSFLVENCTEKWRPISFL